MCLAPDRLLIRVLGKHCNITMNLFKIYSGTVSLTPVTTWGQKVNIKTQKVYAVRVVLASCISSNLEQSTGISSSLKQKQFHVIFLANDYAHAAQSLHDAGQERLVTTSS